MASSSKSRQQRPAAPTAQQPIPLQTLPRASDATEHSTGTTHFGASYQPGDAHGRSAAAGPAPMGADFAGISTYWEQANVGGDRRNDDLGSRGKDPHSDVPQIMGIEAHEAAAAYFEEGADTESCESDSVPLKPTAQPPGRVGRPATGPSEARSSFQTMETGNSRLRQRDAHMLGYNLDRAFPADGSASERRSRSPSTSGAFSRAGSMVRAMSQRVVMMGGEADFEQRDRSRSPSADGQRPSASPRAGPVCVASLLPPQTLQRAPEKRPATEVVDAATVVQQAPWPARMANPLKGRSLGLFSPDNWLRLRLCNMLVHAATEPLILLLIMAQTVLLAIESAPDVFSNPRPRRWGATRIDFAIFGLFVLFTLEVAARIVVSGFVHNAAEYADPRSKQTVVERVAEHYQAIFQPGRLKSLGRPQPPNPHGYGQTGLARAWTGLQVPGTWQDSQRLQLARRAFLRHGFNRLDLVAVASFWISFVLGVCGSESARHLYVFRMLSCLRIVRLLAMTRGNMIILHSLKKAAPLLVRVSFLIGFFWLVFAIVGVQSFKSSLSRQCHWIDSAEPTNLTATYTPPMQFCGGYLDPATNATRPWVRLLEPGNLARTQEGAPSAKGFLCPRGSMCVEGANPYNGTVHFDDIAHSLELVFVIMSANTFSDLMYYTMDSDYLPAALYFGVGIMIMMLWMTNLLIAVITSSFQVIREESKASAFAADQERCDEKRADNVVLRQASLLQRVYDRVGGVFVLVVAFGLVAQATRSATMGPERARFLVVAETLVTAVLDLEALWRIAADVRGFWKQPRNGVDLALAVVTSAMLVAPVSESRAYAWLSIFQIVRVYRVVLALPMTRTLIRLVLGNVSGIANLVVFVFLMTFLMAIFACQLFRGEIAAADDDGDAIRIPFNTIYNAFLGMYQVLSTENWTDVLYHATAFTTKWHTSWVGAVFLIGWFIMAYFILVNMFIAVIQENFDISEDMKRLEQVRAFLQRKELGSASSNLTLSTMFSLGKSRRKKDPLDHGPATTEMLLKEAVVREFLDDAADQPEAAGSLPSSAPAAPGPVARLVQTLRRRVCGREPNPFNAHLLADLDGRSRSQDPREMAQQAMKATATRKKEQRAYLRRHPRYNTSLFLFAPSNRLRRACQRLVGPGRGAERFEGVEPNKYAWYAFSAFIYAAIVAMVLLACVTTPLYQKLYFDSHPFRLLNWFVWSDTAFAIVFTVEAVIKVIADGFFWTPNAYFRSSWGIIDGVVLVTLWINVITLFSNDGAVSRAVGAFKALRALRLLNVSDSARDTFHALVVVGGWKIISAACVSLSLLIPFAVYGVNLFGGKLVACSDGDGIVDLVDCQAEFNSTPFRHDWGMLAPRVAANPYFNFDDFGSALFVLFQISSQEGWVDVSFAVQAITGLGRQPSPGHAEGNALFFVVFNLMATVFFLTLFISVWMRNYTEQTGVAYLTAEQRSWLELRKLLRQISPSKRSYDDARPRWHQWCHKRATEKHGPWYRAVTCVLVLHLVLLLGEFYAEPYWWTKTRDVLFLVFTLLYMTNNAIRIVGLGWARFRRSSWDLYGLVVVAGAFATSVLFLSEAYMATYVQLHKGFLVAIILLLIPRNDALDQLFKTAAASLTTIGNLLATWLVFFLVFAIALTQTFSLTRFGDGETTNLNLRTVPNALILLFRISAGEGWNEIMEDFAAIEPPFCVVGESFFLSDCGSTSWARVLFILWNIISMYIFVNLFVSLIYESFSYVYQRTAAIAHVDRVEIRRFKEAWRSVDPDGTGFISKQDFPRLLAKLSGVFEMRIYPPAHSVRAILDDVQTYPSTSHGIDIVKLNRRLAEIDVAELRRRRRRFNIFFEEVMVSADPDQGISFTTVLMILAHYKIISDSKSLRLEEFLRRRARLQRVEEEVRRRVVLGFFDMLHYARQFQRHMENKRAARLSTIPNLDLPEILVEHEDERPAATDQTSATTSLLAHDPRLHPLAAPSSPSTRLFPADPTQFDVPDTASCPGWAPAIRRASAVSPAQVRDMLDDSVWMASIRRSATTRRSQNLWPGGRKSQGHGLSGWPPQGP